MAPQSMTTQQLLSSPGREFILLTGKDGSGKSTSIVSIAWFVQNVLNPDARFFVIDTENKFRNALGSFGTNAPTNITYWQCENMNDVTEAAAQVMEQRKAGDWVAAESMSRIWEKSQDMGYLAVSGYDKATYLEKRRDIAVKMGNKNAPVVTPSPDQFWNIVKGAHDGAFLDMFAQANSLNVVLSTTIKKDSGDGNSKFGKNKTREEVKVEFGIDIGIDGAPRLPYYAETFIVQDLQQGKVRARIIRDNPSRVDPSRIEFEVGEKMAFASEFWTKTGRL